ncbi:MAG: hypothetical protein QXL94_01180 [Candidatus Parvarchaeum sp.]
MSIKLKLDSSSFRVDVFKLTIAIEVSEEGDYEDTTFICTTGNNVIDFEETSLLYGMLNAFNFAVDTPKHYIESLMIYALKVNELFSGALKFANMAEQNDRSDDEDDGWTMYA